MTSLISNVDEIDSLYIKDMPAGKPIKTCRAVRVDNETLFINDKGEVYTTRHKGWAFLPGCEVSIKMATALHKLGAITEVQLNAHLEYGKAVSKRRDLLWNAGRVEEASKFLGIKLTPTQLEILAAAKGGAT